MQKFYLNSLLLLTLTALSPWHCSFAESLVFPPYLHSYGIRKATPMDLFMFFGIKTSFSDPQGIATAHLKSWKNLKNNKDDDIVVYGVNSGKCEIIFNSSMRTLGRYGEKGCGKDQFLFPKGIAADANGNVFVADSGNNRIVRLFNPLSKLIWKTSFNGASMNDAGLSGPSRVAVDEKVNVYANDPGHRRIVVFDSTNAIVRTIPSASIDFKFFDGPTALAIADGASHWSHNNSEQLLFCADKNGSRVLKFSFDGHLLAQTDMPSGHIACYGATDYYHNFWVTDQKNHCIVKFDHNLKLLDVFGSFGNKKNQFIEPRGIAIFKRFGQVFIAEKKGAQYFWIGTNCKKAALTENADGRYLLYINATEPTLVSLFTSFSNDTQYFLKQRLIPSGNSTLNFVTEEKKRIPERGLTLKTEATYSSFSFVASYCPINVTNSISR